MHIIGFILTFNLLGDGGGGSGGEGGYVLDGW